MPTAASPPPLSPPLPPPPAPARPAPPPRRPGLDRGLLVGVALALLVPLALGGWAWRSVAQAAAFGGAWQHGQQALTALAALQAVLAAADAPGAETDHPAAPLRRAADAQLTELRTLLAAEPEAYNATVALGTLLARRFDALNAAAAADSRPRKGAAAAPPPAPEGPSPGERARAALQALQQTVQAAMPARQAGADAASGRAQVLVALACATAAAVLALLGAALLRERRQARQALASAGQAQQARNEAQVALQRVFDASFDAVGLVDTHGRWARVGSAGERLWGVGAAALLGQPAPVRLLPEERRRCELALEAVPAGAAGIELRTRMRRDDGSPALLQWRAQRLAEDGSLLCLVRDVTESEAQRAELTRVQEALQACGTELDLLRAQATQAARVREGFMTHLGAGLRSSPTAIVVMADNLLQGLAGPLGDAQQRELVRLRETARSLAARIGAVLDLALAEGGQLVLSKEPFDLWDMLTQLAPELRDLVEKKGLHWEAQIADDLGYARADLGRVRQVLREMVELAVRASSTGTVTLRAGAPASGLIRISVADSSGGADEATLAATFDPFRAGGGGLGAALAQRLARLMGGELGVRRVPGQGSLYTCTLPADAVQAT